MTYGSVRRIAGTVAASLVASLLVTVFVAVPAAEAAPGKLTETFAGNVLSDPLKWLASTSGDTGVHPCLTALAPGASIQLGGGTSIVGCDSTLTDSVGNGALVLTTAGGQQAATLLFNQKLPSAAGLDISFYQAQYGGSNADGISFYTKDGNNTDTTPGIPGGGLGYKGLKAALFGVGFDRYGNFRNTSGAMDSGCGVQSALEHAVTVRGADTSAAKDGSSGYCILGGGQVPLSLFGTTTNTRAQAQRPTRIIVDPTTDASPKIKVYMWDSGSLTQDVTTATYSLVVDQPAEYKATEWIKFGFSASTGGATNIHAISLLGISTVAATTGKKLYVVPDPSTVAAGATPTYTSKVYTDAAHTTLVTPSDYANYSVPTCTSAYDINTTGAGTLPITCSGGSAALFEFDYTATSTLTVTKGTPSILPATQTVSGTKGKAITATTAYTARNFTPTSYTISPALPDGLTINATTGVISGIPNVVSASTEYTVTASGGGDSASAKVTIAIADRIAATLSPESQTVVWYKGEVVPPLPAWVPANFNGPVNYSCVGSVPLQLSCGGPQGSVGGTPLAVGSGVLTIEANDTPIAGPGAPPPTLTYTVQRAQARINYTVIERTAWNYTVNYDANGGSGTMASQTGTGGAVTLTNNTFTRTGYTFSGWQNETGTAYTNGQTITMTGALTLNLKAQWTQNRVITLTPETQTVTGKVNTAISTTAYTTTGYTGTVKYTITPALPGTLTLNANTGVITGTPSAVLQTTTYTVTAADGTDTKTATISITVGSQTDWTYLVEYSANGGTGTMARQTGTASSVKLSKNTFTRTGYTFSGWKDKYAGGSYTDEQSLQLTKSGDFLMEAQWTLATLPKITPESQVIQGVAGKALTPSRAYTAVNFSGPVTYTITPALPTGVTINASSGVISGTPAAAMATVNYTVKASYQTESATALVDLFVTADGTNGNGDGSGGGGGDNNGGGGGGGAIAYAISFDANGGTGTMAGITGTGAVTINLPKNAFTSGVMSFVKWQDDNGVVYTDGQSLQITKSTSLVLHAQWIPNEANVGSFTKPAPVRPGATQPVSFQRSSNALSAVSNAVLRKWNLKTVAAITIAGFVEPVGSSKNDFSLSLNRAKAVAAVMAKKYKGLRIKTIGLGRQTARKCRPFKNKCAYITIMVMKDGRSVKG